MEEEKEKNKFRIRNGGEKKVGKNKSTGNK